MKFYQGILHRTQVGAGVWLILSSSFFPADTWKLAVGLLMIFWGLSDGVIGVEKDG